MIRFVYFDAGFTLLRPHPSVGFHYTEVAREFGVTVDPARIERAFFEAWPTARRLAGQYPGLPYGRNLAEARRFWAEVVRQCFLLAGAAVPEDPGFQRLLFDRFAGAECWRLYPDVEPAFLWLEKRGVRYGVLSNWDPRLHAVLEGLGLRDRLSAVVISSEAGAEKPDPAIYELARRAAGEPPPEETGMIGDQMEEDVEGPRRVGWKAALVSRAGEGGGGELLDTVRTLLGSA